MAAPHHPGSHPGPGPARLPIRGRRAPLLVLVALALLVGLAAPAASLSTGVDVSSYQHPGGNPIDWKAVRAAGHEFAFIKATEAANYTNPYFTKDWTAAGGAGLYRGAYHFARPALPLSTAVDQARYFVSRTGTMTDAPDLPGVLDLETTGGLGPTDLAAWTRTWLAEVGRLTGKAPIVYTGYYFWRDQVGNPTDIGATYRLWLPSYPADPSSTTFRPLVPKGWATWTFWQYTSTGTVPGIPGSVDVNRFCCDLASLGSLGGSGAGAGLPFGNLEAVDRVPGSVGLTGWAIDPDTTGPVTIHAYVDGAYAGQASASARRPDVGAAYPGWSADHGFSFSVPVGPGAHRVCAYAINVGAGPTNPQLGCQTVVGVPMGNLDVASSTGPGQVTAEGWAVDPDTDGPVAVDLYVDGTMVARTGTGVPRADVAQALSGVGGTGGFSATVPGLLAGSHQLCAYAINVGSGTENPQIGCRTVTVRGGAPTGNFEAATPAFGAVRVQGWATDPDTTAPLAVHVYVDGGWGGALTADGARADVGQAFPMMGAGHGFSAELPVPSGSHRVCTYAIDPTGGPNTELGCRTVTVSGAPTGHFEGIVRAWNLVGVRGWTIDPDDWVPVTVKVRIDGVVVGTFTADGDRPDVGAAYPLYGPAHGFDQIVATTSGRHTVCLTAVNLGRGTTDTDLGCAVV